MSTELTILVGSDTLESGCHQKQGCFMPVTGMDSILDVASTLPGKLLTLTIGID